MSTLPVRLYAAFAAEQGGGNLGGVVFEDQPLQPDQRQAIAADLGAPTTGFVHRLSETSFQTRFHSTRSEMDMCGHVTVAVFAALLDDNRIGPGTYVQETPAGPIPVEVAVNGQITMHQPQPVYDLNAATPKEMAVLLGVDETVISGVTAASTALRHIFVEMADLESLAAIRPKDDALRIYSNQNAIDTVGVWCLLSSDAGKATVRIRDLCHGVGDPEEAASGTTNSALACDLWRHGRVVATETGTVSLLSEQGVEMGRPSQVHTQLHVEGGQLTGVSVGGFAVLRMTGEIFESNRHPVGGVPYSNDP